MATIMVTIQRDRTAICRMIVLLVPAFRLARKTP
jgi:hypothetical protein